MEFSSEPWVIKRALAVLRQRQPHIKVRCCCRAAGGLGMLVGCWWDSLGRCTGPCRLQPCRPLRLPQVLVSVGGAEFTNWAGLNPPAIKNFVDWLGADLIDGIDIDYEVSAAAWGRLSGPLADCLAGGACRASPRDSCARLSPAPPHPPTHAARGGWLHLWRRCGRGVRH